MKFTESMSVGEAIQQIREKTGVGGPDYGLFQPVRRKKDLKPRWLKNDKSFMSYEIESEVVFLRLQIPINTLFKQLLEYKKRHRLLKIKLLDQTQKTILIDDAYSTTDMVAFIGEKMGLKNPEEFSLAVEGSPEGEWLHPHLTLHEQGVSDDAVIVLKKKFFVSDANIDTENPLTLHYLYLQSLSQIMAGQHPLSPDEAFTFGALQCQIHYGNFDPEKHKVGFLKGKLKDYLPPQHMKLKDPEIQIFKMYKKFVGMSETNAKMRFVQLCRSLKTYGITYFMAKEAPGGQNKTSKKMKAILIGVTRDAFMRIDPETKEVLTNYSLRHIRRWAATKNTFTLDVGDYSESYLHFQSPDSEKISQLLSGYIDIILKRTKDTGHVNEEDDSQIASEEEVGIVRSVALATMSTSFGYVTPSSQNTLRDSNSGPTTVKSGPAGPGFAPASTKLVIANKTSANQALSTLIDALSGSLAESPMTNNQNVPERAVELLQEYMAALTGVAIPLLDVGRIEGEAAKLNLDTIAKQVGIQASKLADQIVLTAMGTTYGANMIDAAKKVCQSMKDLISNAEILAHSPSDQAAKQAIQKASQLFKIAKVQLQSAPTGKLLDTPSQQLLNSSATALNFAVEDFVDALAENKDPKLKNIMDNTKQVAEEIVSAISTYAPLLLTQEYKNVLNEPLKGLQSQLISFEDIQKSLGSELEPEILTAWRGVAQCLDQINKATVSSVTEDVLARPKTLAEASKGISMATARLLSSVGMGDINLVSSSTDATKVAVDTIIMAGRASANAAKDKQAAASLLAACDYVLEAFKNVVNAANVASDDPSNEDKQTALLTATQKLAAASQKLVGDAEKQSARDELRASTKSVIASAIPLSLNAKAIAKSLGNMDLLKSAKATSDAIMELINSLHLDEKNNIDSPDKLISSAKEASVTLSSLIAASKAIVPSVSDFATKNSLQNYAEASARHLNDLLVATKSITNANGAVEFDNTLQTISIADSVLDATLIASTSGLLKPGVGQTEENAGQLLTVSAKQFANLAEKLVAVARNPGPQGTVALGTAAKALGSGITTISNCASTFASVVPNKDAQRKILLAAKELLASASSLLTAAKAASANPTDEILSKMLQNSITSVGDQVSKVIGSIRASDDPISQDTDAAIEAITADTLRLTPSSFNSGDFATFANEIENNSKALQAIVSQVLDVAQNNPRELGVAAQTTAGIISSLINISNMAAGTVAKDEDKYNLIDSTRKLSQTVARLLGAAKASALNKDDAELKSDLRKHSKAVSDCMDTLNNTLNAAIPGIKLADSALQEILRASGQVNTPIITDIPKSSGTLLEELTQAARELANSTAKIISTARSNPEACGQYALNAAAAVAKILNATRPVSVATTSGNTEKLKQFLDPAKKIEEAIKSLVESEGKPTGIINAMKVIAAGTSELVGTTKSTATTLTDPNNQQKLLKAAQGIAEPSSKLVAAAKAAAQKQPNSHKPMVQAANELQDTINSVLTVVNAVTSNLDPTALTSESTHPFDHLSNSAKALAGQTSSLIEASKTVSVKPKDTAAHFELSKAAKSVSDALQVLLSSAQGLAPDTVKCDEAVQSISSSMENLEASLLSATIGGLDLIHDKDHQQCKEQLMTDSIGLSNVITKLVNSTLNRNTAEVGEAATESAVKINTLLQAATIAASTTSDIRSQKQLLELAKIVSESVLGLLTAIKSGEQSQVNDKARESSDAIKNIVSTLKLGVVGVRDCDEAAKAIINSVKLLDMPGEPNNKSYKQCKDDLSNSNKALIASIQHLVAAAKTNVAELGPTSRAVSETMNKVIQASKNSINASGNPAVKESLMNGAKAVAGAARELIINSKVLATDPSNPNSLKKLAASQKMLGDTVEILVSSMSTGELDCEDAIDEIRGIIANLDAASLFASAGQLESEEKGVTTLEDSQNNLNNCTKELEVAYNKLSDSNVSETLGLSAKQIAKLLAKLGTSTKTTAAMLNDSLSQQKLITASKGSTLATQQLLLAAKNRSVSPEDAQAQESLKKAIVDAIESLDSLRKTTETTLADATIGDKKINAAKAEILRMLDRFEEADYYGNTNASVFDVVDTSKSVATSTAHLLSACTKSQDDLIEAAKNTAKETNALLSNLKGVMRLTKDSATKKAIPEAASLCVKAMTNLFDSVKNQGGKMHSAVGQQKMSDASEKVLIYCFWKSNGLEGC